MKDAGLERFWRRAGRDQRRFVDEAFAGVAKDYDRLVRIFSGGLDRRWRRCCVEACEIPRGGWILDCATGTGALALGAAQQAGATGRVLGIDACGPMLMEGRHKARKARAPLACVRARAECLPLRPEVVSAVTLGLALRHMDMKEALAEMTRVLIPGGRVALVEFLRPPPGVAPWMALGTCGGWCRHWPDCWRGTGRPGTWPPICLARSRQGHQLPTCWRQWRVLACVWSRSDRCLRRWYGSWLP